MKPEARPEVAEPETDADSDAYDSRVQPVLGRSRAEPLCGLAGGVPLRWKGRPSGVGGTREGVSWDEALELASGDGGAVQRRLDARLCCSPSGQARLVSAGPDADAQSSAGSSKIHEWLRSMSPSSLSPCTAESSPSSSARRLLVSRKSSPVMPRNAKTTGRARAGSSSRRAASAAARASRASARRPLSPRCSSTPAPPRQPATPAIPRRRRRHGLP
mmetsp:Transcript_5750/g.14726  ORF Transcript_5750/g.14726 Transcript_5750/m.14726 type:complete len:217 (-) Transcript_5750:243-893(-)